MNKKNWNMTKKISYFELLKLVKKGKQPNKVSFDGHSFIWDGGRYYIEHTCHSLIDEFYEFEMFERNIYI